MGDVIHQSSPWREGPADVTCWVTFWFRDWRAVCSPGTQELDFESRRCVRGGWLETYRVCFRRVGHNPRQLRSRPTSRSVRGRGNYSDGFNTDGRAAAPHRIARAAACRVREPFTDTG